MTRQCGVNKNLFKGYNFEDHIWYQNSNLRGDLLYLAARATKIGSTYYIKKAGGDHWMTFTSIVDAEKEACNTWMGATLPSGRVVDSELIKTFFHGEEFQQVQTPAVKPGQPPKTSHISVKVGSCPNVGQRMVIPFGPQFIVYKKQPYLNTWYNDMVMGDAAQLALGKAVLLMVYGSLCNGKVDKENMDTEADRVYDMVVNDTFDNLEFRFLVYWLAAIVQNPGINLQTNIWLIGKIQGLGKGTIVDIMRLILGAEFVGELNQDEIEAGWNDHLVGLQLVEVNEFDTSNNKKGWSGQTWGKWIKGHTIEPTLKIRERNKTSYTVLHIGNFIGTSNTVEQTFIDADDRRNQFIQTTPDASWVQYATALQIKYFKTRPLDVASGFAFILDNVKVDLDFIAKSHKNQFRNSIAANTQSIIEEWVDNDPTITKGVKRMAGEWYEEFKNWWRVSHPSDPIPSGTAFGKCMGKSEHLGIMAKSDMKGKNYTFELPPDTTPHKLEDSVDALNKVTKDSGKIIVYDLDIVEPVIDHGALTPIQRLRAALIKQENSENRGMVG